MQVSWHGLEHYVYSLFQAIVTWLLQAIQHPNIIQVMASLIHHGQLMIIMLLVDGDNLHDIVFGGKHQVVCSISSKVGVTKSCNVLCISYR